MKFDLSTEVIDDAYIEYKEAHVELMLGASDDAYVLDLIKQLRGIRDFVAILKANVEDQTIENQAPPLISEDLRDSIIT